VAGSSSDPPEGDGYELEREGDKLTYRYVGPERSREMRNEIIERNRTATHRESKK
jgi:hypothetical protein